MYQFPLFYRNILPFALYNFLNEYYKYERTIYKHYKIYNYVLKHI